MRPTSQRMKEDVQDALATLRTLRDELRVQIHLGGMDAREKFNELERELGQVQAAARHAKDTSITALTAAFLELKASLKPKAAGSGERPERR